VRTRTIERQNQPTRLVEAAARQPVHEFFDVQGDLVGFWTPSYMKTVNVPGYHFHFLSADRQQGGVLLILAMTFGGTTFYFWQKKRQFLVILTGGFYLALVAFMATPHWNWELNNSEFAVKPVAALIRQFVPPGYDIYLSRHHSRRTLDFYSGRRVEAHSKETLERLWQERAIHPFILLKNQELDQVNLPNHRVYGQTGRYTLVGPVLTLPAQEHSPTCPLPKL